MEEFEGLPGIEEYLGSLDSDKYKIRVSNLNHISEALVAYCGFSKEQSERLLSLFFQEIRKLMLTEKIIDFRKLGDFFISSPKTTNNIIRTFPKFKPKKSLIKELNNE